VHESNVGKIAFITGAGAGIGRAMAKKIAGLGYTIVLADISEDALAETLSEIKKVNSQSNHGTRVVDVTNDENVAAAIKSVVEEYGKLDLLINNAGVSSMNDVENMTNKEWDFNFDVNIKGMFFCTRAAIPYLKQSKGKIVNTASLAALKAVPLLAHYAASKAAVASFTKSVAVELAPFGINVNCVCPGYVKTSMQQREIVWEAEKRNMTPQEVLDDYINQTPMGRLCDPEDVANAVALLISDDASFITGVALPVTGGVEL